MWCFCYMLRHIHRTIVYEIHTPPAGFTQYKCECDAAFNRRWKQYNFFIQWRKSLTSIWIGHGWDTQAYERPTP